MTEKKRILLIDNEAGLCRMMVKIKNMTMGVTFTED